MSHIGGRRRVGEQVYLNVYDLSPANEYMVGLGLGVFHSGLEVYGTEYTFGSGGGVFSHPPKQAGGHQFRERVYLGDVMMGHREVETVVAGLRSSFPGEKYNVLSNNCNHFADALARELLGRGLPGWINRLAYLGSWFSCLLPASMTSEAPVDAPGSGGGSGSGSGFSMMGGGGRAATTGAGSGSGGGKGGGAWGTFSGEGRTLAAASGGDASSSGAGGAAASATSASAASGGGSGEAVLDRRERALRAAEERARQAQASSI